LEEGTEYETNFEIVTAEKLGRSDPAIAFDRKQNIVYIHGGKKNGVLLGDLITFNLDTSTISIHTQKVRNKLF
jgi:hypothetical protein